MKIKIVVLVSVIGLLLIGTVNQSCGEQARQELQKVYRIVYVQKPNDWYIEQAKLWKKEIEKDRKNPEAWYNYYNAVRYARYQETIDTKEKQDRLKQIIEKMEEAIPGTYVYYLLKFWNNYSLTDISLLEKAYELKPEKPDTYYGFISHYEYTGDKAKLKEFLTKLYKSEDIAPILLNYNYNVLMSIEKNGILFTNGDNDTYPVWILQHVKKVRPDVTILNVHLIQAGKKYLERKLEAKGITIHYDSLPAYHNENFVPELCKYIAQNYSEIPVYFALTVYENYTEPLKSDLYVVGLASQYNLNRMDNLALLKKNLEMNFRLDYLEYNWYGEKYLANSFHFLNMNYVVPMLMLAEHYKQAANPDKAERWKQTALNLAKKAGKKDQIKTYIQKKNL